MAQIIIDEGAAPSTPASGKVASYAKTDGLLYSKDDAGNEYQLSGAQTTGIATVASATTVDIFGAAGATINLTGTTTTTTVSNCTTAQVGSTKRIITAGAWPVTASASLTIDGATSGTTTYPAGAELEIRALTTSTFAIRTVYATGTWTPNQGAGLTVVGAFSSSGVFVRQDNHVSLQYTVTGATSVAAAANSIITGNIPFTASARYAMGAGLSSASGIITPIQISPSSITSLTGSTAIAATPSIYCHVEYNV